MLLKGAPGGTFTEGGYGSTYEILGSHNWECCGGTGYVAGVGNKWGPYMGNNLGHIWGNRWGHIWGTNGAIYGGTDGAIYGEQMGPFMGEQMGPYMGNRWAHISYGGQKEPYIGGANGPYHTEHMNIIQIHSVAGTKIIYRVRKYITHINANTTWTCALHSHTNSHLCWQAPL